MSLPTVAFSILTPSKEADTPPTESIVVKIVKNTDSISVIRDDNTYKYTVESVDNYSHWLLLIIRDSLSKVQNGGLKISSNLGVGDIIAADFRDITEIVGKILELLKGSISTTQS